MPDARLAGVPRVLVIDDDQLVARSIARMLSGCSVELEIEARRAIARIRANEPFDLVICDLWMPQFDGNDVLVAIRAHFAGRSDQPAVIMTSGSDELLDERRYSDVSVLHKPFRGEALRALVKALVSARVAG